MDLFPDFKDLLAAFVASKVEFVLLGGYAVIFHGRPRATKDLDLLVGIDDTNRKRLAGALETFGAPANVVDAAQVLAAGEVLYFGFSPLRVDILASASGIDFPSVFRRAVTNDTRWLTGARHLTRRRRLSRVSSRRRDGFPPGAWRRSRSLPPAEQRRGSVRRRR